LPSPYKRAIDTIKDFAERTGLKINIADDFRERKVDSVWIEDFNKFSEMQWGNFEYKLSDGENLNQVQKRNAAALQQILKENMDENIVIGTHGTALSTIINYYDKNFDYKEFQRISPTILLDAATIKNNPKQIKENIKDKNPNLIFMLNPLNYLQKLLEAAYFDNLSISIIVSLSPVVINLATQILSYETYNLQPVLLPSLL